MRTLQLVLVAACAALAGAGGGAAQNLPELERGDSGEAVELWQDHLGEWVAYARPALGIADPRGSFGADTEEATRELQRSVGLEATGRVDERTWLNLYDRLGARAEILLRRSEAVTPAWPIPVPAWFWPWARWYLGHAEFRDRARDPAVRPAAAPTRIPNWGWRRMLVTNGDGLDQQAVTLVSDRVDAIFGETLRLPADVRRSEVAGAWALVTSSLVGHDQGPVAAWLRLVRGRWVPWNLGRVFPEQPDRPQANADPRLAPCDLRPVFEDAAC